MQVTKKIKRGKLLELFALIQWFEKAELKEPLKSRFTNALAVNQEVVEPIARAYTKLQKTDTAYLKYDEARVELAKTFALKDEKGEPIVRNGAFSFGNKLVEFNTALEVIQNSDEHREAFQAREDYLSEEVEVKLQTVDIKYVPDVGLSMWKLMTDFITDSGKEG